MFEIIIKYFGIFLSVVANIFFVKTILNKKIEISHKLLLTIILITAIIITLINMNFVNFFRTIMILIIHIIEIKVLFNESISKTVFAMFIYTIFLTISEIIVIFLTVEVIRTSKIYFYNTFAGSVIGTISVSALLLLFGFLLKNRLRKLLNFKLETSKKILIFSFLTLLCVLMLFYNFAFVHKINKNVIPYILAIIVFLTILFSLYKQKMENDKLANQYDKLLIFIKTYEEEIEKQRIFCHETKNQFITIKSKILDKDKNNNIVKYIDEILDENTSIKQEQYAKFKYLPANGIKGLFYFKCKEAEEKKIKVSINISSSIQKSILYKLTSKEFKDLGRILGVYLDNAIEASEISETKQMGIEIYQKKEDIIIIISNTYQNIIDNNKIGKKAYSTKGKNRGHGLLLVNAIINVNNMFSTSTEITTNTYIQILSIKKA